MIVLRNKFFNKAVQESIYNRVRDSRLLPRIGKIMKHEGQKHAAEAGMTYREMVHEAPKDMQLMLKHIEENNPKAFTRHMYKMQEAEQKAPEFVGELGFMDKRVPLKKRAFLKRRYDRKYNGGDRSKWKHNTRKDNEAESAVGKSLERVLTRKTGVGTVAQPNP